VLSDDSAEIAARRFLHFDFDRRAFIECNLTTQKFLIAL
jgi:hypothetical protein